MRSLLLPPPKRGPAYPAWVKCPACENFLCVIHSMHAHDCPCPSLEVWDEAGIDPYSEGSENTPSSVAAMVAASGVADV